MSWLIDLISNPYFMTAVSSWAVAQVIKTLLYWAINRKLDLWRLCGDGGMPSGHSATVASLAMFSALAHGLASFEFAVTCILAIIVCHDATGVRQETGKQAVLLNQITDLINDLTDDALSDEVKLKEFVGHTGTQVIAGVLVGMINASLLFYFVY